MVRLFPSFVYLLSLFALFASFTENINNGQASPVEESDVDEEELEPDRPLDHRGFMEFSVQGIAEQLTRIDSVSVKYHIHHQQCFSFFWPIMWTREAHEERWGSERSSCQGSIPVNCPICLLGSFCEGGSIPVFGLRLVSARQREPLAHHPCHHRSVQCCYQPGHLLNPVSSSQLQPTLHTLPQPTPCPESKGHWQMDKGGPGEHSSTKKF